MSTVEKAFIKRLLEGVIERKTELDTRIENFTGRSVSRLHPAVRQILRMGIYQIYYMDAVPDSAVCNEAVQLAKRHAPARLSGFVNGVLRNAARQAAAEEKAADLSGAGKDGTERKTEAGGMGHAMDADAMVRKMCVEYSMPAWLVRMWSEQLGMEETAKLLGALMEIRPVSARLSGRLSEEERQDLLAQLQAAGVIVEEGRWLSDCRYLRRTSDLRRLPGFSQGLWTVQDESSMLAVKAEGAGTVFSYDLSKRKTDLIRSGAKRLHLDNIQIAERDAREFFKEDKDRADVILCDLPCSGLGVLGKKRDIKYRASMEGLSSLQQLQREILTNAVRYLKSGGVLIYSTCTINRAENEENAAWIAGKLGLQPDALAPYMPEGIPGIQDNMLQLLPHIHGTDGFFIARFRKK